VVGLPNVFRNAEIPEEIELLKVDAGDGLGNPEGADRVPAAEYGDGNLVGLATRSPYQPVMA